MVCPQCGSAADLSSPKCPACGIDFLDWFETRAWSAEKNLHAAPKAPADRLPERATPNNRRRLVLWSVAAGLAGSVGLWVWAAGPGELPALPGALADPVHGFSFVPPSGWTIESPGEPGAGWTEALRLTRAPATIQVLIGPESAWPGRSATEAEALASRQFNGASVSVEAAAPLSLDRIEGFRVSVSGDRTMLPSPNKGRASNALQQGAPAYESMDFRGMLAIAPGAGRVYVVKMYSEREDFKRSEALFEAFLNSLRVTPRPWGWPR